MSYGLPSDYEKGFERGLGGKDGPQSLLDEVLDRNVLGDSGKESIKDAERGFEAGIRERLSREADAE